MMRNGLKRKVSGRLPLTAFSSYDNARLIVVRSKVNWAGGGLADAGARYSVPFGSGRMVVTLLEERRGTENNGFIH
jgi:hypothetical protein